MGKVFNPKPVYPHEQLYSEAELWNMLIEERKMKMIVNKPQFDMEAIKPGQAYWLKKADYYKSINSPCIIQAVKPLTIVVEYWHEKDKKMLQLTIDINSIVDKSFTLEKMIVEGEKCNVN